MCAVSPTVSIALSKHATKEATYSFTAIVQSDRCCGTECYDGCTVRRLLRAVAAAL